MIGVYSNHYYPQTEKEGLILEKLCYHSARLRNTAVYNARQYFFENDGTYIGDARLHADTRKNENYGYMICDMADQTINHVKRNFHSYYGAKKAAIGDDKDKVRLPRYLGKDETWSFFVAGRSVRMKEDGIHIGLTALFRDTYDVKQKDLVLPIRLPMDGKETAQLEVKPRFGGKFYDVTVVHNDKESEEEKKTEPNNHESEENGKAAKKRERLLGFDPGVDNILAGYAYPDGDMFLVKGLAIKAMNQWYNKRKAEIQSIYDIQKVKNGESMIHLVMKRENFMDNELNNIAKQVVDYAIEHRIDRIVAGWNKGIK